MITFADDPIAIISTNTALGISGIETEVCLIIDRAEIDFIPGSFYAFTNFENEVEVKWADSMDDFNSILGKVLICMMKANKDSPISSGFLEDE